MIEVLVAENPIQHISDLVKQLKDYGWSVTPQYVKNVFKRWRWSWKKPQFRQFNKYSAANIDAYGNYLFWLYEQPDWRRIKFLDEVHFVSKGWILVKLHSQLDVARQRGIAPIGKNIILVNKGPLNSENYSVTAFTQLDINNPVVISAATEGANNQLDFIKFLLELIEKGHLVSGDSLVLDNASVHAGLETIEMLHDLITAANVKLVFLPTYSPELNPIELVFMWVKRHLRENRSNAPLWFDIAAAFVLVDLALIKSFYKRCFFLF